MLRYLINIFKHLYQGHFLGQSPSWKSSVLFSVRIVFLKNDRTTAILPCKKVHTGKCCDTAQTTVFLNCECQRQNVTSAERIPCASRAQWWWQKCSHSPASQPVVVLDRKQPYDYHFLSVSHRISELSRGFSLIYSHVMLHCLGFEQGKRFQSQEL